MNTLDGAACTGSDPDLWFPERPDGTDDSDNHGAQAKAICAQCPVLVDCLEGALDRGEEFGIWGGAGGDHMRHLRRARRTGGTTWARALEDHIARLDGNVIGIADRNGPNATHGLRVTYNRGCRCRPCKLAVNWDNDDQADEQPAAVIGQDRSEPLAAVLDLLGRYRTEGVA